MLENVGSSCGVGPASEESDSSQAALASVITNATPNSPKRNLIDSAVYRNGKGLHSPVMRHLVRLPKAYQRRHANWKTSPRCASIPHGWRFLAAIFSRLQVMAWR